MATTTPPTDHGAIQPRHSRFFSAVGITLMADKDSIPENMPHLHSGTGVPSHTSTQGTVYVRSDGTADTTIYVNTDGATTWAPLESSAGNLNILDTFALTFGTPGTDLVMTADGTDVVVTATGDLVFADSVDVAWGTGKDLSVVHNATNTVVTSATGDLIIDNTLATGSTILRLGTDTTATDVQVQNNSESPLLTVLGDGKARIGDAGVVAFGAGDDVTLTHDGTTGLDIAVTDNDSGALTLKEGANTYLNVSTTDGVEKITLGQDIQRAAAARDLSHHLSWVAHEEFYGHADTEAEGTFVLNSGTDAQAIDPALDTAQAGGVWKIVTGNLDGTTAADGSQLVWSKVPIVLNSNTGGYVIEARIRIKTDITFCSVFFGLTDATGLEEAFTNSADTITAVADDAGGFLYDTDATTDEWWGVAVDSTVKDAGNAATGTAPTADVFQILRMEVDATGATVSFFINNAATADLALSGDVGIGPDVPLYATIIANTTAGTPATKTIDVDYLRIEGIR